MYKTNLKIAWLNLVKDKQFTLLNVVGLSAGIACALLIFLWVSDEYSYDKFFTNSDRIYKLLELRTSPDGSGISYSEESSGRLGKTVKESLAGVEYAVTVAPPGWFPQNTLSFNDKNIKANGQYADKDYFNIFSFQLLSGDKNNVLSNKANIVLSDELATKLFGTSENIIGKPVSFDHDTTFFVSGVFKKMQANSSQQFDFVLSFDYFRTIRDWVNHWGNTGPLNYVLLKKDVDIDVFNKNVKDIITTNTGFKRTKVVAMSFPDIYLHNNYNGNAQSGGRIQYVKLFSILALFIMIIACINFMNLSTAKAARRFKEVGIKKVVGAEQSQLIIQFLTESLLLTLFALVLAVGIAALLLPAFNQLTGKAITINFTWQLAAALSGIGLITGLVAGSYPALYISRFNPLSILKGKINTSAAELLSRKGLVVFQFTISTVLIIAVFIIYQQIQYIQNTDPGYNKNNILRIAAEGNLLNRQSAFIEALKKVPGVNNVSATNHGMIGHNFATNGLNWPGKADNDATFFQGFEAGYDFIETLGMHITQGRSFSNSYGGDSSNIILNEAAVAAMNLKDPVGKTIRLSNREMQVIGIVKNFHFESMHDEIKPAYIQLLPELNKIIASIQSNGQQATIKGIENLYKKFNPGFPFTFNFLDEAYQKQYESETKVSVLSKYFAALAIIISCLGLFGLAAFTAQKRRKEIGVRKVVGASVTSITAMLSFDFLKLIGISLLIAFPLAWWLMNSWLQSFTYCINITPVIFIVAALSVVVITVITISFQSIKAALANPVKSLRSE